MQFIINQKKPKFNPELHNRFRLGETTLFHGTAHCRRVLRFVLMIAEAKGLSPEQRETLAAAAVKAKVALQATKNCISVISCGQTQRGGMYMIAEAYYGVPDDIRDRAMKYLDDAQKEILNAFRGEHCGV